MFRFIFLVLCCLIAMSCSRVSHTTAKSKTPVPGIIRQVAQLRPVIMPLDSSHVTYTGLHRPQEVYRFYQSRNGKCFWFSEMENPELRDSFYNMLRVVQYLGLSSGNYHSAAFGQLSDTVRLEALLTDSFISLVHDVKYGWCDGNESHRVNANALDSIRGGPALTDYIRLAEPRFIGYRTLKAALRNVIDSSANVEDDLLRQTLHVICLNLDRWRKLPGLTEQTYVVVNIPAYMLYVVDHDSVILQSRIIVGKPESPTPELIGMIDRITINPCWYVPRKIAVKEYLPLLQTDSSFLAANNFDVLDRKGNLLAPDSINWKSVTPHSFRVTLRQRSGPDNSLGIYKFLFDNPFAVYLHDTNAKGLFNKTKRSFSHGCIRVAKAEALAHYLATGVMDKRSEKIQGAVASGQTQTIRLTKPVKIYVAYLTAEGLNGRLIIHDDLYHYDSGKN